MSADKKLRISVKYGDFEGTYKISESKAPEIFKKLQTIIDPSGMVEDVPTFE